MNAIRTFNLLALMGMSILTGCEGDLRVSAPSEARGPLVDTSVRHGVRASTLHDADGDGLSDEDEHLMGTNAAVTDSDGDGLWDGEELTVFYTDPLDIDSDADALLDGEEVDVFHTNNLDADSDHDGLLDGEEALSLGTSPIEADSDHDGLSDHDELERFFSDPLDPLSPG